MAFATPNGVFNYNNETAMNIIDKAQEIYNNLLNLKSFTNDKSSLSYAAFVLSLLPIPGLQQAAQVMDRILSDKSLANQFNNLWEEIKEIKRDIVDLQEGNNKILSIIVAVKFNSKINTEMEKLINNLLENMSKQTSFEIRTENWSYQTLMKSIVDADLVKILADNNSVNTIENSKITAKHTQLHASNNSSNFVNNSKFKGDKGSVVMQNINTRGKVAVTDNAIELAQGGQLIFGENPNLITRQCSNCSTKIKIDRRQLTQTGLFYITCPNCNMNCKIER